VEKEGGMGALNTGTTASFRENAKAAENTGKMKKYPLWG
jgi:hypothetical protein